MLHSLISPFYQQLFKDELLQVTIQERAATCDNCSMAPKYNPLLKCCTFHPYLPNFLVGAILKNNLHGALALRRKIQNKHYALPIGILASVRHQIEFNQFRSNQFGQKDEWLCPYYDKELSQCGIWAYRGSVCTGFYCKSSYDKSGLEFWSEFSDFLSYVEMALMEEALVEFGFTPRQVSLCVEYLNRKTATRAELAGDSLPEALLRKLWGEHFEHQEVLYLKSYEFVLGLDRDRFQDLLGELGMTLQNGLVQKSAELRN